MIETSGQKPYYDKMFSISKNYFDVVRNALIIATIGFFAKKSNSQVLWSAYYISSAFFGIYLSSLVSTYQLKMSFFADTRQGRTFGLILNLIISLIIFLTLTYIIGKLIAEAMEIQLMK